jgi:tetratricopeptide (TPR) repeat protein
MAKWTAFPHDADAYRYDPATLRKKWGRLHAGDAEPLPSDEKVLAAWQLFHAGEFQKATEAGLKAHGAGIAGAMTVANKSQAIYATYLEGSEKNKLALLLEVAERAERRAQNAPNEANAWYCMAYALGRYSQGISIAKALAQGLGAKVNTALGAFHAEIIDKVGSLLARTQGASKDAGLVHYKTALKLNPGSAIAMIEYANGLVMLEGEKRMKEATKLYEEAAACEPLDATERLDVEMAKAELED